MSKQVTEVRLSKHSSCADAWALIGGGKQKNLVSVSFQLKGIVAANQRSRSVDGATLAYKKDTLSTFVFLHLI